MRQWPLRTSIFAFAVALATGCGGGGGGGSSGGSGASGGDGDDDVLHGPELTERVVEHDPFQPGTAFINIELDFLRLIPRAMEPLYYMLLLDGQLAVYDAKESNAADAVERTPHTFSASNPVPGAPLGYDQDDGHFYFTDNPPDNATSVALYRYNPAMKKLEVIHEPDNARADQGLVPVFVANDRVAIAYINTSDEIEIRSISAQSSVPDDCSSHCLVIGQGDIGLLSNPLLHIGPNGEIFYERYHSSVMEAVAIKIDDSAEFTALNAFWIGFTKPSDKKPVSSNSVEVRETDNNLLFQESIKEIEAVSPSDITETHISDVDGQTTRRWNLKPWEGVYSLFAAEFDDGVQDGFSNQRVDAVVYSRDDDSIYVTVADDGTSSWKTPEQISAFDGGDSVCEVLGLPNLDSNANYESSSILVGYHNEDVDSCSDVDSRLELEWERIRIDGGSAENFPGVPLVPLFNDEGAGSGWLSIDDGDLIEVDIDNLNWDSLQEDDIDEGAFLRAVNSAVSSYTHLAGRAIFVDGDGVTLLSDLEADVGDAQLRSIATDIQDGTPTEHEHGVLDGNISSVDFLTGYGRYRLGYIVADDGTDGTIYAEIHPDGSEVHTRISDDEDNIPVPLF